MLGSVSQEEGRWLKSCSYTRMRGQQKLQLRIYRRERKRGRKEGSKESFFLKKRGES